MYACVVCLLSPKRPALTTDDWLKHLSAFASASCIIAPYAEGTSALWSHNSLDAEFLSVPDSLSESEDNKNVQLQIHRKLVSVMVVTGQVHPQLKSSGMVKDMETW